MTSADDIDIEKILNFMRGFGMHVNFVSLVFAINQFYKTEDVQSIARSLDEIFGDGPIDLDKTRLEIETVKELIKRGIAEVARPSDIDYFKYQWLEKHGSESLNRPLRYCVSRD